MLTSALLRAAHQAHHTRRDTRSFYTTIMSCFYFATEPERRPRVLALTASPAFLTDKAAGGEAGAKGTYVPDAADVRAQLTRMERALDARVWSASAAELLREAPPGTAPRWMGTFTTEYFEGTTLAATAAALVVLDAVRGSAPRVEGHQPAVAARLTDAWEQRVVAKVKAVGDDLGSWAVFRAARLLVDDLTAARIKESVFLSDGDETRDERESSEQLGQVLSDRGVQRAAGSALRRALEPLERLAPEPSDASAHSHKVAQLVQCLLSKAPDKCLVFVNRRIICKLLAELLGRLLPTPSWSVNHLMAVKRSPGSGEAFTASGYASAIYAFRRALRLLVTTATVEEGLDVPSCDCVINFDAPGTQTARTRDHAHQSPPPPHPTPQSNATSHAMKMQVARASTSACAASVCCVRRRCTRVGATRRPCASAELVVCDARRARRHGHGVEAGADATVELARERAARGAARAGYGASQARARSRVRRGHAPPRAVHTQGCAAPAEPRT